MKAYANEIDLLCILALVHRLRCHRFGLRAEAKEQLAQGWQITLQPKEQLLHKDDKPLPGEWMHQLAWLKLSPQQLTLHK